MDWESGYQDNINIRVKYQQLPWKPDLQSASTIYMIRLIIKKAMTLFFHTK